MRIASLKMGNHQVKALIILLTRSPVVTTPFPRRQIWRSHSWKPNRRRRKMNFRPPYPPGPRSYTARPYLRVMTKRNWASVKKASRYPALSLRF
jgi:hypothetical protein